jgi:hypothetical protein
MSHVNTEINAGGNNFCNGVFTEDWHIVVNLNLLCCFTNKCIACKHYSGVIYLFENPSNRRYTVNYLVIKFWEYDHTADMMTSNITKCRLHDYNIPLLYGLRSIGKNRDAGKLLCAVLNIP